MGRLLTPVEIRILGCLIEKEATTPDAYPLSLNALTTACNQKTNREPVLNLTEATVLETVEQLIEDTLIATRTSSGSRVSRYAHRLQNRLEPDYDFSKPELAALCVLFLRGPQTEGEIRIRSSRIHEFSSTELNSVLHRLAEREDGPYAMKLPRQPGQKEARFAHLLAGDIDVDVLTPGQSETAIIMGDEQVRIYELELKVTALRKELDEIKQRLDNFISQFE